MQRSTKQTHSSPSIQDYEELEGFLFVPDDKLNIPSVLSPKTTPSKSPFRNSLIPSVMSALTTVVSSENILVMNIAKTVLTRATRAATTLTTATVAGVPGIAMGALIAGGVYAYRRLRNKPIIEVLRSLSPIQQKQLIMRLRMGLKVLGVEDMAMEILSRSDVKEIALEILSDFLEEKYGLRIIRS